VSLQHVENLHEVRPPFPRRSNAAAQALVSTAVVRISRHSQRSCGTTGKLIREDSPGLLRIRRCTEPTCNANVTICCGGRARQLYVSFRAG